MGRHSTHTDVSPRTPPARPPSKATGEHTLPTRAWRKVLKAIAHMAEKPQRPPAAR